MLASEGFRSVEEVAYVDLAELASIEGFDEDTAEEIQNRAARIIWSASRPRTTSAARLGVADELQEVDGVTTAMLVKLGENDVKTIEDLAGCATDDLVGWTEKKDGETTKHDGFLEASTSPARRPRP